MTKYLSLCAALSALALAGCTDADWDHAMTYTGLSEQRVADAPPVPTPGAQPVAMAAPAPDTSFCEAVAKRDAVGDGFDAATQSRVFQQSFRQCVTLFGAGTATQRTADSR